jgi:hypothetical protein
VAGAAVYGLLVVAMMLPFSKRVVRHAGLLGTVQAVNTQQALNGRRAAYCMCACMSQAVLHVARTRSAPKRIMLAVTFHN